MQSFYAIVFEDGFSAIKTCPWKTVSKLVKGVSKVRYKGFPTAESARDWIQSIKGESGLNRTAPGISKGEWGVRNINTPKWRKRAKAFYSQNAQTD